MRMMIADMIQHDIQRVESDSAELKKRVENVLEMATATMKPLSRSFMGSGIDVSEDGDGQAQPTEKS